MNNTKNRNRIYETSSGKFRVIYDNPDKNGRNQRQKTFDTMKEAQKFYVDIEHKKNHDKLITPKSKTLKEFFEEWIKVYAQQNWQARTYDTNTKIIRNHIYPELGDKELKNITPYDIENFIINLKKKKVSGIAKQASLKNEGEVRKLSPTTVRYIYILLNQAFEKAVEWKLIEESPVLCDVPKKNRNIKRIIWDLDDMKMTLKDIKHEVLHLGVHIALVCSLRPGEVVGITWDCVDFKNLTLKINKTVERISEEALEELPGDEVIKIFPKKNQATTTKVILKTPKTEKSERFVFISDELANELKKRQYTIEMQKNILGQDYKDYNLVLSLEDGTPVETHRMEKWFKKWLNKTQLDIPHIVFQELRYSSATLKLIVSNGDIKSVQGDTGHSSGNMILNTYSQIQDKNRNALTNQISELLYKNDNSKDNQKPIDYKTLEQFLNLLKENYPDIYKSITKDVFKN